MQRTLLILGGKPVSTPAGSQGRKTCRFAGLTADQVRIRYKPQNRQSTWPDSPTDTASSCRRGDRVSAKIKRREFITLLGGAAAAWPLAARAQQSGAMRRIGVLMNLASDDAEGQARLAAFHQGLQQLGWTVGRNVQIDYRWGAGNADYIRKFAAELVALAPDVILSTGSPSVAALQQATRTIPIVFTAVADPVGAGYVDSLARPGGNATGFLVFEYSIAGK